MRRPVLGLILALTVAGCGGSFGKSCTVGGVVTLDDKPIENGAITFRPVDAAQRPESTDIENGDFTLDLPPGKYRVEVHAARPSSGPPVKGMGPVMEDYIPEKYKGGSSVLNAEIQAGQPNRLTFSLVNDRKGRK